MDGKLDAKLVELARSGDREAYGELIHRYQRQICGLACVLLGDRSEAEDVTQEAFLRAWLNLDLLSDSAKFAPWVRRIVFGVSIDWLRAFRPDLYRIADTDTELKLFATPANSETALQALENTELRQRVWQAVSNLPPHYRLPLTLFHLDGLSHSKIAEAIGAEQSTVRSLIARARRKLEPMLASYAMEVLPALQDVLKEQDLGKATMLHITDGESVAGTLRESAIHDEVRVYGDLLYEGPAPEGLDSQAWVGVRAQFLSGNGDLTLDQARRYLESFEDLLGAISKHDETVLWLDHRLSDQLILIKLLDWFNRVQIRGAKLSLICIGRYPGRDRFAGLGQLTANQLTSLADTRLRVSQTQFDLASMAWSAFTSSDPSAIERVIEHDTSALPFLAAALRRHLEQFPSLGSGLSRTERQILSVLREHDSLSAIKLFFAVQQTEDPLFMGDLSFFRILKEMARAHCPLVHIEDAGPLDFRESTKNFARVPIRITEIGQNVLDCRADYIKLNGIDRWLGGVHLTGSTAIWRWDDDRARLVMSPVGS
jgi:RNA polymerase sigma factor (sigma-70 family)